MYIFLIATDWLYINDYEPCYWLCSSTEHCFICLIVCDLSVTKCKVRGTCFITGKQYWRGDDLEELCSPRYSRRGRYFIPLMCTINLEATCNASLYRGDLEITRGSMFLLYKLYQRNAHTHTCMLACAHIRHAQSTCKQYASTHIHIARAHIPHMQTYVHFIMYIVDPKLCSESGLKPPNSFDNKFQEIRTSDTKKTIILSIPVLNNLLYNLYKFIEQNLLQNW